MRREDIPAFVQRARPSMPPKWIIVHDPGQKANEHGVPVPVSAEGVAHFNALPPEVRNPPGVGGYHYTQDGQVQVVEAPDKNRVNGAAEANDGGLHLCLCDYSPAALKASAQLVKRWISAYAIPPIKRTWQEWPTAGMYGHNDVERAIGTPGPHVDPRQFPWTLFVVSLLPAQPVPVGGFVTTIATGQTSPTKGREATLRPVLELGIVLGENGGKVVGSTRSGKNTVWRDPNVPANAKMIDITDLRPTGEKAIAALYDIGGDTATYKAAIA